MADWTPPAEFDGYRLIRPLGRGGMGHVYLGKDVLLERAVAIKFIAAAEVDERLRSRFLTEGRSLARLSHPNVVVVHRVSEVQGRPYLVSEYVRGQTLDALSRPMPWEQVLRIGIGLARGLAAAHRQGVLHRDIKPANAVLADGGEVKLLDFGLAKTGPRENGESFLGSEMGNGFVSARVPLSESTAEFSGVQPANERLIGTPRYMAPEVLDGAPASRRSDLYSFGAILYELCAGHVPRRPRTGESPPLLEHEAPAINLRFAAVVDRCLQTEPSNRWASADELRDALEQVAPTHRSVPLPVGNPYRGLRPFDVEHRALFFGRDADIRRVLERLRSEELVIVAGDSGVGKSSLCRAGVLPLVSDGELDGGLSWSVGRLVPGREPLVRLATAVAPLLRMDVEALTAWLRSEPAALARALERGRQTRPELALLIFVDQAEELISLASKEDASRFAECCKLTHSFSQHVRWLLTIRGDFVTRLAALPGLGEEVQQALYILRPLSPDRLREAVIGPARACGVSFESDESVESLVNAGEPPNGSLPLVAFALSELWEARDEKSARIPAGALNAMGGVSGALARHADGVLAQLLPSQREEARRILLRLVNSDGTRTRRRGDELDAHDGQTVRALDALVTGRLVVVRDRGGQPEYELAHESLARTWPTLATWLDADFESSRARQRVSNAATEWERLGRSHDALWHGRQLAELRDLDMHSLNEQELRFLSVSGGRARLGRLVPMALGLGVVSLVVLSALLSHARTKSGLEAQAATYRKKANDGLSAARSDAAAAALKREEALRLFDGTWKQPQGGPPVRADVRWEDAEAVWSDTLALERRSDSAYASAAAALELALQLNAERSELRHELADVLLEEFRQSQRSFRQPPQGLRERLLAFDTTGSALSQLDASGSVSVAVKPPDAEVRLERYDAAEGLLRPTAVSNPAFHSGVEAALPAGSYRLVVARPGSANIYYPFWVHPQQRTEISLNSPKDGSVPEGYVYIPAGPFLLGSADDETVRQMQDAPPLHEARTPSFLISESEVTFEQWIAYLEANGARARAHLPNIENSKGLIRLTRGAGHWRLQLRPTDQDYIADWGAPVRYQGRDRLSVQDWRRFPVTGVALVDIQDYLRWLVASGHMPGARLCTEWEWERAARGADARPFTTGNVLPASTANIDVTYGRKPEAFGPDEVGSHPESDSPFGLHDIEGNALEIVEGMRPDQPAVGRGGAWYYDAFNARLTAREVFEPQTRSVFAGFRVCASREEP